jgi:hypothetical protein
VLYGSDGTALAEFADDHVSASTDGEDTEQRWREWELELSEDAIARGSADEQLLARLSNRLRDAGATPAAHASKLARVLGSSVSAPGPGPGSDDSVHRAVAEEIEALLTWDRAVRADVEDSVHQMRVTIRTIRSLLQASASVFGLTGDAGLLDELRELAAVLGTARATRRCSPNATSEPSTNCPAMWCAVLSVSAWSMGLSNATVRDCENR